MSTPKKIIVILMGLIGLSLLGLGGYEFYSMWMENQKQKADLSAAGEMLEFERRQAQEDLQAMQAEINEYSAMNIGNDSLMAELEEQKQKVQLSLEELKTVKSTDAKKIADLKAELGVVRNVLKDYIRKVDSLSRINKTLRFENDSMRARVEEATAQRNQLVKDKAVLTEAVNRAAMIDVDILSIKTLDKRGKEKDNLRKISSIAVMLQIAKNQTAKVGYKTIYIRIRKPDRELLSHDASNTFRYEGHRIGYSMKKDIEYKGEKMTQTIFYPVNETLLPGTYSVQVFIDGDALAEGNFTLK